jgi:hypothetical protein
MDMKPQSLIYILVYIYIYIYIPSVKTPVYHLKDTRRKILKTQTGLCYMLKILIHMHCDSQATINCRI